MRGIAAVLSIAFVFAASSSLLGGTAAAQASEPGMAPAPDGQQPTDAVIQGAVRSGAGPVAGAVVSSYNYGGPVYATDGGGSSGSTGSAGSTEPDRMPYYGGASTTTGADGSFRLGVYSGSNSLSVYHDGYAPASLTVEVQPGQTVAQDITVEKYPDKTARIAGRVTDARTGDGLAFASVSVSSPLYGRYECSMREGEDGGGGEVKPMPAGDSVSDSGGGDASTSIVAPGYYESTGCAITVHPDGRFEGLVTPGYSIVSVYAYADCVYGDGGSYSSSSCGPQYFSASRTLDLPANATTAVNVALRSLPGPDAVVSGYLVDDETGQAIPGAQIHFSNLETYGYGWATTDGDGSYSLRLRSGFHQVSVHAPGHLPWEGNLDVDVGDSDFDVALTPGEASYGGGCCWLAEGRGGIAAMDSSAASGAPSGAGAEGGDGSQDDAQQAVQYEDLHGGLGPYDAEERRQHLASADGDDADGGADNGIPGAGALLAVAALVGAAIVARRRA